MISSICSFEKKIWDYQMNYFNGANMSLIQSPWLESNIPHRSFPCNLSVALSRLRNKKKVKAIDLLGESFIVHTFECHLLVLAKPHLQNLDKYLLGRYQPGVLSFNLYWLPILFLLIKWDNLFSKCWFNADLRTKKNQLGAKLYHLLSSVSMFLWVSLHLNGVGIGRRIKVPSNREIG